MSEVDNEDLNRVHERIDEIQQNRVKDLKDLNDCLTSIKKNIAGIEENLENQKVTLEEVAAKTENLADERKDWKKVIENDIEKHMAECPATDIVKVSENRGKRKLVKQFAQDHPWLTGGSGVAVGAALLKFTTKILEIML